VAVGRDAGNHLVTGIRNTFVGNQAGSNTYAGTYNTAVGSLALGNMIFGDYNTAVGDEAGRNCLDAQNAVFMGKAAGREGQTASNTTIIGAYAAGGVKVVNDSVIIGHNAGNSHTTDLNAKLIIANDKSTAKAPLISGDFAKGFAGVDILPEKVRTRLHLRNVDSGSTLAPKFDGMLVEGGGSAALTLETNSTGFSAVLFATPDNNAAAALQYSAGSGSLDMMIGTNIMLRANLTQNALRPGADNAYSLGQATYRMSTIYAGTGSINTSDEREKQDIRDLTDAEKRVAIALKGSMKAYRFKDAVAEKGDKARIHFGTIAQTVKAAFEAEGLVAEDYGVLCYDEWPEQAAELDEKGDVVVPAVAAGNRYGVRYDELFAFIIAAL
jgi:hypothetical protein